MAASMPVSRPRRKSGAVTSCSQDTGGAELHKRRAEASGFYRTARLGRTGHKERTLWLVGQVGSKDDDGETPSPESEPAVAGRAKNFLAEIRMEGGRRLRGWLIGSDGLTCETQAECQGSFPEQLTARHARVDRGRVILISRFAYNTASCDAARSETNLESQVGARTRRSYISSASGTGRQASRLKAYALIARSPVSTVRRVFARNC
jgi:hypothetical protein